MKKKLMDLKFKELRGYLSVLDRLSICEKETGYYYNFSYLSEVPDTWDDRFVYGIGRIESEFFPNEYELGSRELEGRALNDGRYLLNCIEIMVSKEPKMITVRELIEDE